MPGTGQGPGVGAEEQREIGSVRETQFGRGPSGAKHAWAVVPVSYRTARSDLSGESPSAWA